MTLNGALMLIVMQTTQQRILSKRKSRIRRKKPHRFIASTAPPTYLPI